MNCADFEERILDWCDNRLSAADRHVVETHVATCAACRQFWADHRMLDARLAAALPRPALSGDFKRQVLRRVDATATADTPALREQKRRTLEAEFRTGCQALRKNLLSVSNLLDLVGCGALAIAAGLFLYHFAGDLSFIPAKSTGAFFENPLVLASCIGGALALVWGWSLTRQPETARWINWF
jgi:anti-sigma factor RsiW